VGVLWLLWERLGISDLLTGGLLLFPAATLLLPRTLAARLRSLLLVDSSVFYRFSLWESVFRVPFPFLLFGVGEGKRAMLALLSPVLAAGLSHVEHTHSLFLHLLVAGGLVGLFLFLLCILTALCGKGRRECRAALLALLLFGLFDDPLYSGQTEVIFWLVLGLC
jgi:O-antigen ligase